MGQRRFEQEFGRKLHDREIEPSAGSWDKLEARLEATEKKRHFPFKWIGVAASLAGGLLIGSMVYHQNGTIETPQVVESPTQEIKITEEQLSGKNEVALEIAEPLKMEESKGDNKEVKSGKDSNPTNEALAVVGTEEKSTTEETWNERDISAVNDAEIDKMLEKAMATIASEKGQNGGITDAEVEGLLQMAAADIRMAEMASRTEYVDSGSLLMEVEMELEKTYREKVFEILKESYSKTRTAVANRSL